MELSLVLFISYIFTFKRKSLLVKHGACSDFVEAERLFFVSKQPETV